MRQRLTPGGLAGGHAVRRGLTRGGLAGLCLWLWLPIQAWAQDDNPTRRWEYFYEQRAYPFDSIPTRALQRARQQAIAQWPAQPLAGAARAPAGAPGVWTPIGPEQIPSSITSTGRLSAIAVDPNDSNIIYIGGAQGGVWKTVDGGASWTPRTDKECSLAMGGLAIDPTNTNIVYAGTGEQHNSGDSYYGCGVLESTDGGTTWSQVGASVFDDDPGGGAAIARVVLKPGTPTTVFVASTRGLHRSMDSGTSWQLVLAGRVSDVVADPTNGNLLYAGVASRNPATDGVHKSTDGGSTWSRMVTGFATGSLFRINLDIAPSSPQTLFAGVVDGGDITNLIGVYKTVDGATTWSKTVATGLSCGQCWYDMFVSLHPTDPSTVYFGAVGLYKSTDSGAIFNRIGTQIHVDQHFLAYDPQDPATIFVGNDGGIYKSVDGGTNWTTLNTNLALTQFYGGLSLHPSDGNTLLGGTQDNGTLEYAGSTAWLRVIGGDGGYTAIDFLDPSTRYGETQWNENFGGPRRSDGGGYARKVNGINTSDAAAFIPPMIMDPLTPHTLYFGMSRLYRTRDRGEIWSAVSPYLSSGVITAIAVAPSDPQTIYIGSNAGDVQVSTDHGATWSSRTNGLPNRFIKDFAMHPTDPQTAYVSVSGFFSGHVFKTINGGLSWQDISTGLSDLPVNAILLEPGAPATIYAGSDLGVYRSTNDGATWDPFNTGLPLVAVFDIAAEANTGSLVVATHGRGMWTTSINAALSIGVFPASRSDTLPIGPNTSADSALVNLLGTGASGTAWTATHGGSTWLSLDTSAGNGRARVRWTRDATGLFAGTYVDTITVSAAGVPGSPVQVIDSLLVEGALAMAVGSSSRVGSVGVGSTTAVPDSVAVTISGQGATLAAWSATHGGGSWVTLTDSSGTGAGVARWTRDPTGLALGTYVDTITVSVPAASGSPAQVIDSLLVESVGAMTVDPASRVDSLVAGFPGNVLDSASVTFTGSPHTVAWTATHGSAPWLALTQASGTDNGVVRWLWTASNLAAGTHVDTITVTGAGATGSPTSVLVTLEVSTPVALADAVDHLVLGTGLSGLQAAFLDSVGNQDGTFNLGDVLAWLDRCRSPSPGGCLASSADIERASNIAAAAVGDEEPRDEEPRDAEPDPDGTLRRQP